MVDLKAIKGKSEASQILRFYGIEGRDLSKGNVSLTKTKETRGKFGVALHVANFTGGDTWIIDSGASDHMTYDKSFFVSMSSSSISHVSNANGASFPVLGIGSVQVTPSIILHDVLYVPSLSHHLLSVSQLSSQNKCSITFYPMYVVFQNLCSRVIIGKGDLRGRLFHLDCMYAEPAQAPKQPLALTLNSNRLSELWLWHRRLGHPSFRVMKKSMPSLFLGISESTLHCETCALAKSHRSSYPLAFHSSTMPFELIHSDLWGLSKNSTLSEMRYFVLFIDDFTRLSWVAQEMQHHRPPPTFILSKMPTAKMPNCISLHRELSRASLSLRCHWRRIRMINNCWPGALKASVASL